MEVSIEYLSRATSGIYQSPEQLALDKEGLEMNIDFALQSLYGKVGAASVQYAIRDYKRRQSFASLAVPDQE